MNFAKILRRIFLYTHTHSSPERFLHGFALVAGVLDQLNRIRLQSNSRCFFMCDARRFSLKSLVDLIHCISTLGCRVKRKGCQNERAISSRPAMLKKFTAQYATMYIHYAGNRCFKRLQHVPTFNTRNSGTTQITIVPCPIGQWYPLAILLRIWTGIELFFSSSPAIYTNQIFINSVRRCNLFFFTSRLFTRMRACK